MKKKDTTALRGKSMTELLKMAGEKSKEKALKNSKKLRLEIARILTLAKEAEIIEKEKETKSEKE